MILEINRYLKTKISNFWRFLIAQLTQTEHALEDSVL